jgi:hypothetical protein
VTDRASQGMNGKIIGTILTGSLLLFFWDSGFVYPFRILVVFFHEMGHALMTVITGGRVAELGLNHMEGGHTLSMGGNRFLILNAGYLGSLLSGVAILRWVRSERAGERVAVALGILLLTVAMGWVRPMADFGFVYCLLTGAGFIFLGTKIGKGMGLSIVRTVGLFSVMYALVDIKDDVFRAPSGTMSDAAMLSAEFGLPTVVWGLIWIAVGGGLVWKMRAKLLG